MRIIDQYQFIFYHFISYFPKCKIGRLRIHDERDDIEKRQ